MKSYSRRNFLKLSSWGMVASLLPFQQINALSFIAKLSGFNPEDYQAATEIAKQAKAHFYKKEFDQAEKLLLQCIELAPADIRFYDNLKAVYGAQGKYLHTIELFKNGLAANMDKIAFYDRAARSLMQLEIGNSKVANEYKNAIGSNSLLKDAKQLYRRAIAIDEEKEYLKVGLKKVRKKIKEKEAGIDYRTDQGYRGARKKRIKKHKNRYNRWSTDRLKRQLQALEEKQRTALFIENEKQNQQTTCNKEKRTIYQVLVKKYRKNKQFEAALSFALAWYTISPRDGEAIKKVDRLFLKTKNYRGLIDFRKNQVEKYPTVWANLGLIKAMHKAHRNDVPVSLEECSVICNTLLNEWGVTGQLGITIKDMEAKNQFMMKRPEMAKQIYEGILKNEKLFSKGLTIRILNGYAKGLLKTNQIKLAQELIAAILYSAKTTIVPSLFQDYISVAEEANSYTKLPLKYTLYRSYKKQGDIVKQQALLKEILTIDPNNRFALKRV